MRKPEKWVDCLYKLVHLTIDRRTGRIEATNHCYEAVGELSCDKVSIYYEPKFWWKIEEAASHCCGGVSCCDWKWDEWHRSCC
jgi:hypothetical protein